MDTYSTLITSILGSLDARLPSEKDDSEPWHYALRIDGSGLPAASTGSHSDLIELTRMTAVSILHVPRPPLDSQAQSRVEEASMDIQPYKIFSTMEDYRLQEDKRIAGLRIGSILSLLSTSRRWAQTSGSAGSGGAAQLLYDLEETRLFWWSRQASTTYILREYSPIEWLQLAYRGCFGEDGTFSEAARWSRGVGSRRPLDAAQSASSEGRNPRNSLSLHAPTARETNALYSAARARLDALSGALWPADRMAAVDLAREPWVRVLGALARAAGAFDDIGRGVQVVRATDAHAGAEQKEDHQQGGGLGGRGRGRVCLVRLEEEAAAGMAPPCSLRPLLVREGMGVGGQAGGRSEAGAHGNGDVEDEDEDEDEDEEDGLSSSSGSDGMMADGRYDAIADGEDQDGGASGEGGFPAESPVHFRGGGRAALVPRAGGRRGTADSLWDTDLDPDSPRQIGRGHARTPEPSRPRNSLFAAALDTVRSGLRLVGARGGNVEDDGEHGGDGADQPAVGRPGRLEKRLFQPKPEAKRPPVPAVPTAVVSSLGASAARGECPHLCWPKVDGIQLQTMRPAAGEEEQEEGMEVDGPEAEPAGMSGDGARRGSVHAALNESMLRFQALTEGSAEYAAATGRARLALARQTASAVVEAGAALLRVLVILETSGLHRPSAGERWGGVDPQVRAGAAGALRRLEEALARGRGEEAECSWLARGAAAGRSPHGLWQYGYDQRYGHGQGHPGGMDGAPAAAHARVSPEERNAMVLLDQIHVRAGRSARRIVALLDEAAGPLARLSARVHGALRHARQTTLQLMAPHARRGFLRRNWLPLLVGSGAAAFGGYRLWQRGGLSMETFRGAMSGVEGFYREHFDGPVKSIANEVLRGSQGIEGGPSAKEIGGAQASLQRMLGDFYTELADDRVPVPGEPVVASGVGNGGGGTGGGGDAAAPQQTGLLPSVGPAEVLDRQQAEQLALQLDLGVVSRLYEGELRTPIRSLLAGNMTRLLLLQTEHLRVQMLRALGAMDTMLKAQHFNLQAMALLPALYASAAAASGAAALYSRLRRPVAVDKLRESLAALVDALDREICAVVASPGGLRGAVLGADEDAGVGAAGLSYSDVGVLVRGAGRSSAGLQPPHSSSSGSYTQDPPLPGSVYHRPGSSSISMGRGMGAGASSQGSGSWQTQGYPGSGTGPSGSAAHGPSHGSDTHPSEHAASSSSNSLPSARLQSLRHHHKQGPAPGPGQHVAAPIHVQVPLAYDQHSHGEHVHGTYTDGEMGWGMDGGASPGPPPGSIVSRSPTDAPMPPSASEAGSVAARRAADGVIGAGQRQGAPSDHGWRQGLPTVPEGGSEREDSPAGTAREATAVSSVSSDARLRRGGGGAQGYTLPTRSARGSGPVALPRGTAPLQSGFGDASLGRVLLLVLTLTKRLGELAGARPQLRGDCERAALELAEVSAAGVTPLHRLLALRRAKGSLPILRASPGGDLVESAMGVVGL